MEYIIDKCHIWGRAWEWGPLLNFICKLAAHMPLREHAYFTEMVYHSPVEEFGGHKNMKRFSSCRWTPQTKQKHFPFLHLTWEEKKSSIWNHNVGQRFPHVFQTLWHLNKNYFLCSWESNAIRHRHQNLLCCDIDIIGGVTERTVIARSSDLLQTQWVFGNEKMWEVRRPRECKISTHNLSVTATALVL